MSKHKIKKLKWILMKDRIWVLQFSQTIIVEKQF